MPKSWSGWGLVRRIALVFAVAMAISYPLLFLYLRHEGIHRPDLLMDAALAGFAGWFLWRAGPRTTGQVNACPACTHRMRRTRTSAGARFWTCFNCGYEQPRDRPGSQGRTPIG